jgi:hypothetical protein
VWFNFSHMCSVLFVHKPCDQKRLEVTCGRTLKHPVDICLHILVVVVQLMAIFCV